MLSGERIQFSLLLLLLLLLLCCCVLFAVVLFLHAELCRKIFCPRYLHSFRRCKPVHKNKTVQATSSTARCWMGVRSLLVTVGALVDGCLLLILLA